MRGDQTKPDRSFARIPRNLQKVGVLTFLSVCVQVCTDHDNIKNCTGV